VQCAGEAATDGVSFWQRDAPCPIHGAVDGGAELTAAHQAEV